MDNYNKNEISELTNTLFALKGLSQDLSKERDVIIASASQISFSSKQFQKYSDRFEEQIEESKNHMQQILSQEIKDVAKRISEEVSRNLVESIVHKTEEGGRKLNTILIDCQERLEKSSKKLNFMSRWFVISILGATLIGGLVGGGIIHYSFPKMDEQVLAQIRSGEAMQVIWSKLDKKEKDKLSAIYTGNSYKGR